MARLSAIGATVDPAYLRAIESGSKRPRLDSEIVDALATVYKNRPAAEPAPPVAGDVAALTGLVHDLMLRVDALIDQNATLMEQLVDLVAGRLEDGGAGDPHASPKRRGAGAPPRAIGGKAATR